MIDLKKEIKKKLHTLHMLNYREFFTNEEWKKVRYNYFKAEEHQRTKINEIATALNDLINEKVGVDEDKAEKVLMHSYAMMDWSTAKCAKALSAANILGVRTN